VCAKQPSITAHFLEEQHNQTPLTCLGLEHRLNDVLGARAQAKTHRVVRFAAEVALVTTRSTTV
jgi:hypothetical protein